MIDDATPLGDVRDWLRARVEHGERCPCCTQFAKVYRRPLPRATALVMVELFKRNEGREWVCLPEVLDTMKGTPHQGGYGTLGQFWGLMEPMPGERDDGSTRVGWWRLTDRGRAFVCGVAVPKYARVYNGRCLGVEGKAWSIHDALGHPFDYRELMGGGE